jgi:hypothetical protein
MSYIKAAAVIIMLFVLPGVSWWYLQSGLDYQKQIRVDIAPKRSILNTGILAGSKSKVEELLKDKITVFAADSTFSEKQQDIIDRIAEKYGNREFFQFQTLKDQVAKEVVSSLSVDPDSIYLVDKDMVIRNAYSWSDTDITTLVEHTATLIPLPERQSISLKRDIEHAEGN